MSNESFYSILGVEPSASKDDIKKAYRTLQMKYHPDRNPGNAEANLMTQKINEAYETLSDDKLKAEYDMGGSGLDDLLNMLFRGGGGHGIHVINTPMGMGFRPMGMGPMGMGMGPMGMGPMAEQIPVGLGGQIPVGLAGQFNKPPPIIQTLEITMEQMFKGGSFPLEIEKWSIENNMKIFEQEKIYVDVPAGVDDHEFIILRNRGNTVSDTCKGDIKVQIAIVNKTSFKRQGLDLIYEKTITLKEALCGFSFQLDHINGSSYALNRNKGCIVQPEYKHTYHNLGIVRGEYKGNLIIHFHVSFPEYSLEQINKLAEVL